MLFLIGPLQLNPPCEPGNTAQLQENALSDRPLVALTRRIPAACETRLAASYRVRLGDDARVYTPELIAAHAEGASALIVSPAETIDARTIAALPATVKVISTFSVGYEHIDIPAAAQRGIPVTNTPGVLTEATADLTILLMLGAARRAGEGERLLRAGQWTGLRPTLLLGSQFSGKRLGIVGLGRIGAATAARATAFGLSILYHGRKKSADAPEDWQYFAELDRMLPLCDVLSLNCALTAETRNLLDARRLALLPQGAIVVNAARGGLIVDEALIAALKSGHVAAAGLDVYANEPNLDRRYTNLENVFLLPHLGSATVETRQAMGMLAIDNLEAVLAGRTPPFLVKP